MIKKFLSSVIKLILLIVLFLVCAKDVHAIDMSSMSKQDLHKNAILGAKSSENSGINFDIVAYNVEDDKENNQASNNKKENIDNQTQNDNSQKDQNKDDSNVQENNNTIEDKQEHNNEKPNTTNTESGNNTQQNTQNNTNTDSTNGKNNSTKDPQEVVTSAQPVKNTSTKQKSSNTNLKELKLDIEGLTPEFNSRVTEYYLVVDMDVKEIKVTTTAAHNKAEVKVTGNKDLKKGKNTITIEVKAENGGTKKYYIYVTKTDNIEKANSSLKMLEITDYNLSPKFNANILNYNLNLKQGTTNIEVATSTENDKATVKIEGNNNLQEGENIVEITVTAEDKTTQRVYRVNAYVLPNSVEIQEENKTPIIIALAIIGAFIVGIISFLLYKKNRHIS